MSEQSSPVVIFVLGGPGAGKGTQCANLVKDFSFVHLSAGDLLRAEMAREGSEFGELISTYIKEGQIVPMEVTLKLIQQAMAQSPGSMVLLDGFPRKMDQALEFEKAVAPCKAVLYFTCTEKAMLERLLKRGETSGRSDDNKESIVKRFQTFHETSFPVIQHYQAENKVIEIDTLDTPDNVYLATKAQIQKLLGITSQDEAPVAAAEPESIPEPASIPEPQETSEGIVADTSATSDSMLPEIQVGNNSNLSEVLEQLNIDPQPEAVEESSPVTEEAPKEEQAPTSEEKAAPVEQQGEPKVEAAPVQAPVVTEPESVTKSPVSEIEIVEDTIPKPDAPTSPKDAAPAQNASTEATSQTPAQPASPGPASPKSTKSHSKKKSNCLVM